MIAYIWNKQKLYCGIINVDESPLEKGQFLLPKNGTLIAPVKQKGKRNKWTGASWELID